MSLPIAQLQLIRDELDSNAVLYGGLSNADAAAEMMAKDKPQVRESMAGSEIFRQTDADEFEAKTLDQRNEWLGFCSINELDPSNGTPAAQIVVRIFGNPSQTLTNLLAARSELVTRASQIGVGNVTSEDVKLARAL